jgi:hypothetical protein
MCNFCKIVAASNSGRHPNSDGIHRRVNSKAACGFVGNSDLFGVGVRIGLYCQAFAVWFATYFVRREGRALRSVNTLFMLASLIGFAVLSANSETTFAAEAYILPGIVLGTYNVGTVNVHKYSRKCWEISREQTVVRDISAIVLGGLFAWFWWKGLDHFKPTPCGTYGYFFYKFDLYGPSEHS